MKGDGEKPRATVMRTVTVVVKRSQPDGPRRLYADDGTVTALYEWMRETGIYPLRGFGSSGPGHFIGVFDLDDEGELLEFLRSRGVETEVEEDG